jgi:hypothetical protein
LSVFFDQHCAAREAGSGFLFPSGIGPVDLHPWPLSHGARFSTFFTLEDAIEVHVCSLRLKRYQACDQWHSSRVFAPLTGSHCKLRPNTEGIVNSFIQRELTNILSPPYGFRLPLFEQNLEKPYSATALGVLRVHVKSANDLWNMDFTSLSDPFCVIEVSEPPGTRALQQKRQTRHIMDDLNPVWNENFEFLVQSSAAVLTFTLYDWDEWGASPDLLGQAQETVILEVLAPNVLRRGHFDLSGTKFGGSKGTLNVDLEWKPFAVSPSSGRCVPSFLRLLLTFTVYCLA